MTGDGGWAERMSARAKAREALKPTWPEEPPIDPQVAERWTTFVDAHGGWGASLYPRSYTISTETWIWLDCEPPSPGDPDLVYSHGHGAHTGALKDAATGKTVGTYSYVIPDGWRPPKICPVCDTFAEEWSP